MTLTRQYFYVAPPGSHSHSPLADQTRASRNSSGPLSSRRLRLACSSAGADDDDLTESATGNGWPLMPGADGPENGR
jgi:hypothetical protein